MNPRRRATSSRGDALSDGPAGDAEEVLPITLGEAAIPFGEVGGDGEGRTIQLVTQDVETARKSSRQARDPGPSHRSPGPEFVTGLQQIPLPGMNPFGVSDLAY